MASIQKLTHKNGNEVYRVRFRRYDCLQYTVSLTFTNLEDAHNFIETYEPMFKTDPKSVWELKDQFRIDMQSRCVKEDEGMKKPRFRL